MSASPTAEHASAATDAELLGVAAAAVDWRCDDPASAAK